MIMNNYNKTSHSKSLIRFHLILVCKYRKPLLNNSINESILKLFKDICLKHKINIVSINTDKDHLHALLECHPNTNISNEIRTIKSYTTFHIWEMYSSYLSKCFWKEHTFWSDGYFVSSIGEISSSTVINYIESQGHNN